ncbi:MAG: arginase family protein, partial [Acidimicrobiales bacterium]
EALAASDITRTNGAKVGQVIPAHGPIYVHLDGDVVDPADMPAMNYPAADGPSLEAVAAALADLAGTGRLVAFSVSSWNPALPGAETAAAAMLSLAQPFFDFR